MINVNESMILSDIISQIKQSAEYTYDVLVRGTIVSNTIDFVSLIIWLVVILYVISEAKKRVTNKEMEVDDENILVFILIVGIIAMVAFFVITTLGNMVMGIVVPEYVVINNIIAAT